MREVDDFLSNKGFLRPIAVKTQIMVNENQLYYIEKKKEKK